MAGNAKISGTLTASNFSPGNLFSFVAQRGGNSTVAGPRPYIDVTSPVFGAIADGGAEQASGTIASGSNQLTIAPGIGTWKVGMGLHVDGAGASGDVLLAHITAINGSIFTLDRNAGTSVSSASVQDDDTLAIEGALNAYAPHRPTRTAARSIFHRGITLFRRISRQPECDAVPDRVLGSAFAGREQRATQRHAVRPAAIGVAFWAIADRAPTRSRCSGRTIRTGTSRFRIW